MLIRLREAWILPGELRVHFFDFASFVDAVGTFAVAFAVGLELRVGDELLELADGDLMDSHVEAFGQFHLVRRFLSLTTRLRLR